MTVAKTTNNEGGNARTLLVKPSLARGTLHRVAFTSDYFGAMRAEKRRAGIRLNPGQKKKKTKGKEKGPVKRKKKGRLNVTGKHKSAWEKPKEARRGERRGPKGASERYHPFRPSKMLGATPPRQGG